MTKMTEIEYEEYRRATRVILSLVARGDDFNAIVNWIGDESYFRTRDGKESSRSRQSRFRVSLGDYASGAIDQRDSIVGAAPREEKSAQRLPEEFVRILPNPIQRPHSAGDRLRLSREKNSSFVTLESERVLPEKVSDPNARARTVYDSIDLSRDEMIWLRDRLTEALR